MRVSMDFQHGHWNALVRLSGKDLALANTLANARNQKQDRFGEMTYGGVRRGREAHLLGIMPEIAVARFFNTYVDRRILGGGDDGTDLYVPGIGRVAVKSTTYVEKPWLRVECEHFHRSIDYYVACAYRQSMGESVQIVGFATPFEVSRGQQRRLLDGGPMNLLLPARALHSVFDLKKAA